MDDLISRADVEQTVEDNILCYTHSDRPIDQDPDTECHMAIRTALRMLRKDLRKLPSAQPEPCEDAVSRQRLLSDLKELTAAWGKYPVMAEQIKGVEAAIGYAETIPSAQPEQRWIPCSERLPEDDEIVLVSDGIDYAVAFWRSDAEAWDDPLHGWLDSFGFDVKAWMPLPEPYEERREE